MARSHWTPPPLPREHGAWVIFGLPLVLGAGLAGIGSAAAWLVACAALLAFLSHHALVPLLQRRLGGRPAPPGFNGSRAAWGSAYWAGALVIFAAAAALTPATHRSWLLVISVGAATGAAAYTAASILGAGRRIAFELIGMAALSLSAPVMALAAGAPIEAPLAAASALAFTYSASALAFVRAYRRLDQARRRAVAGCVAAHILLIGGLILMSGAGWFPPWLLIALVPVVIRTAWGLARPPRNLRQLGLREIWVALSFTVVATALIAAG